MPSKLRRLAASPIIACLFVLTLGVLALRAEEPCNPAPFQFVASRFGALQKKYVNSIVLVNCGGDLTQARNIGTGFLIDSKAGLLLTALHVVKDKNGSYDCSNPDGRLVAYPLGDMCEHTDLEYITGDTFLDVALIHVKRPSSAAETNRLPHFYFDKPHFELMMKGMRVTEDLMLIGFSQFAAIRNNYDEESPEGRTLPGIAWGHECTGQPQPYNFNPVTLRSQQIADKSPQFVRENGIDHGDSGAPIFLEDGRVAGIVTEKVFYGGGTKVTSAKGIVDWLVPVLASREDLKDGVNSLEAWTLARDMYRALNPDTCSSSCVSNVRIATEFQRIVQKSISFEAFKADQLEKLSCPLYTAAVVREIDPQKEFLREKLRELGVRVAAAGYTFARYATAVLKSSRYTANSKVAALELAETVLARDLDALLQREPDILAAAICASGVNVDQTGAVESVVDNYLSNFRRSESAEPRARSDSCPGDLAAARLRQVKELTTMIADIKLSQVSLAKKLGEAHDVSSSVATTALAAIVNAGDKKGASALIDLGDTILKTDPELAAKAYAKAFEINPGARARAGFAHAVSVSWDLQAKAAPNTKAAIANFPTIDQNSVAAIISDTGLILPGGPRF